MSGSPDDGRKMNDLKEIPLRLSPGIASPRCTPSAPFYKPCAACATARNRARPLFIVSSHSFCGSES